VGRESLLDGRAFFGAQAAPYLVVVGKSVDAIIWRLLEKLESVAIGRILP